MLRSSHISANLRTFDPTFQAYAGSTWWSGRSEWTNIDGEEVAQFASQQKTTRNKKAEEYLSTQDHHFQFLYCFVLCFFVKHVLFFFVLGGLVAPYVSYRQFFVTEGSTLLPVPEWKVPVLPHQPIPTLTSQQAWLGEGEWLPDFPGLWRLCFF